MSEDKYIVKILDNNQELIFNLNNSGVFTKNGRKQAKEFLEELLKNPDKNHQNIYTLSVNLIGCYVDKNDNEAVNYITNTLLKSNLNYLNKFGMIISCIFHISDKKNSLESMKKMTNLLLEYFNNYDLNDINFNYNISETCRQNDSIFLQLISSIFCIIDKCIEKKDFNSLKDIIIKISSNRNLGYNFMKNVIKYIFDKYNDIGDRKKLFYSVILGENLDFINENKFFNNILLYTIEYNKKDDLKEILDLSIENNIIISNLFLDKIIEYYINNNIVNEIYGDLFNKIINNNDYINFIYISNISIRIFEKLKESSLLDNVKNMVVSISESKLNDENKILLLDYIIEELTKMKKFDTLKEVLTTVFDKKLISQQIVRNLQIFLNKYFKNNESDIIEEGIINIFSSPLLNNLDKSNIILYIIDQNINLNIPNFTNNMLNFILNAKNFNNESKILTINSIAYQYISNSKLEDLHRIINNILSSKIDYEYKIIFLDFIINNKKLINDKMQNANSNLDSLNVLLNSLENSRLFLITSKQEQIIELVNNSEIKKYLYEKLGIIHNNSDKFNNDIKPLENAEKNIVSHITDTHGDSLAVLGSLKQTGFIGELTGEMLFYNVNNKQFYNLEEIKNLLEYKTLEELKSDFVIIPDFKLPDKIPEGIFVHTGDIQDRGQESAESFVILRRVMDLYKEEYKKQNLSEDEIKEKLINKIVITTSDHDDYVTSHLNELKYKKSLYIEELLFEENFNKHHKIQEDMFIDGYINSGRLIQTNNENLKILVNHSYVDANSVALVLMAIIFPYNDIIYSNIPLGSINSKYMTNLRGKLKEIEKSEKYREINKIFNKIKANIINYSLEKEVDTENIDEETLNVACNNFFERCNSGKMNLNGFFTALRECMGIPVKSDNYKSSKMLTATETLEAFSMGTKVIDEFNREKMKNATNDNEKHYNDPIINLITSRNGRTFRDNCFFDSENSNGTGLTAAPIDNLLIDGIIVLNGHDVIQKDKQIKNNKQMINIRNAGNYLNDRSVSYAVNGIYNNTPNNNLSTYIAPQIFKINEKGQIVSGIYNPIEIKRGKFSSKIYGEPNLESTKIENIYIIQKEEIENKLGLGTEESFVPIAANINNITNELNNLNKDTDFIKI